MLLGLRTVIYHVPDLENAKRWYSSVFDIQPYFDQPFYVGFSVGGYELGLDPDPNADGPGPGGTTAFWGVADLADTVTRLHERGIATNGPVQDVGGGIKLVTIADPYGNVIGLIENPHFGGSAAE
jgi:predicted enzyme related to lactoylglutathione lyase